jgi:hypothetical protein
MTTKRDGTLYVSNILAERYSSLTYDQYNAILEDFFQSGAAAAAHAAGAHVELQTQEIYLEELLSPEAAQALRQFSQVANRTMLHPLDRQRWNQFLSFAYRDKATLNSSLLKRWLMEEERWSEDGATQLAIEYENAKDLLAVYESQRAGW